MSNPTYGYESQFVPGLVSSATVSGFNILTPIVNPTNGEQIQFDDNADGVQDWSQYPLPLNPIVRLRLNPTNFNAQSQFIPTAEPSVKYNITGSSSNIGPEYFSKFATRAIGSSIRGVTGLTSTLLPTSDQLSGDGFLSNALRGGAGNTVTPYNALPFQQLRGIPGVKYSDFRSRLGYTQDPEASMFENASAALASLKAPGVSAAIRGSFIGAAYAAASASPIGAYSVFNRVATYGYGEHDDPNAIKLDFTARTNIATRWKRKGKNGGQFVVTLNPLELAIPFRGDRVNAVDYKQRNRFSIYTWKPQAESIFGLDLTKINNFSSRIGLNKTQDFIKFYFTGPKLSPGSNKNVVDDVIAFRAIITSMDDSFSADWNSVQMVGRADPNYHYGSYSRGGSLSFDVYATDRDELKPIYRKLNALASYTAPIYDGSTIAMVGPWMRLTVGDIHNQQPIVLTSVTFNYSFDDPWEINIEQDRYNMQVPFKVSVTCNFNIVGNDIPQNNGRILSLAKEYKDGKAKQGNTNWLSDFNDNIPDPEPPIQGGKSPRKGQQKRARQKELRKNGLSRKEARTKAKKEGF